jgi:hypothetical protein
MRIDRRLLALAAIILTACCSIGSAQSRQTISLAGTWSFRTDPADVGEEQRWFLGKLADTIRLPGSMAENEIGDPVSVETKWTGGIVDRSWFTDSKYEKYRRPGNVKVPFWLNPVNVYLGAAWYQREIEIPRSWKKRVVTLYLERCHWETRLWVDDQPLGTHNSLATPHVYDLSRFTPGKHRLTLRIDNRIKEVDVGRNAHSVTDHTQSNWNGIVGRIELRAASPVSIASIALFPDIHKKAVRVQLTIRNTTGAAQTATLEFSAKQITLGRSQRLPMMKTDLSVAGDSCIAEYSYPLGNDALLWDEFDPNLYELDVVLNSNSGEPADARSLRFGLREFGVQGTRFSINGRPAFLRGTLECAIFPKTGYASMDIREWKRIFRICKSYGLNHVRFHSWCPPEAAFDAADEEGLYLYVECGAWTLVGDGKPFDQWLYEESGRIVREYGNHPSFCMMSYGNEPSGKNQAKFLGEFVNYWKKKDGRRVYTSGAGWPLIPESDFHLTDQPRIQLWGAGLNSIINKEPPQSAYDFRAFVSKHDKPVVSHEIGQWCVYPNFKEIRKYTGVLRAKNFEIFRESLRERRMADQADEFLMASGKLQVLCYKADIEAALRTPGMAGFELLDLHDFPGQGTALIGVLDPFWGEKGYVTSKEYSRFCNSTVPLARLKKMVFLNDEKFEADVEVAHFGKASLNRVTPRWRIRDQRGRLMAEGILNEVDIPVGNAFKLGSIQLYLDGWPTGKMNLEVSVGTYSNDWDFWVYPSLPASSVSRSIVVAERLDSAAVQALEAGQSVLLLPDTSMINSNVPPGFSSIFWNTAWTSRQAPHTLGILCNPKHPALRDFPTDFHSNWQWWDLVVNSRAMILDSLNHRLRPVVQVVDDWFTNRKLGLVFEAKVGKGKLLVCSIDLTSDLEKRPVARQLRASLERYVASKEFSPQVSLRISDLRSVFHRTPSESLIR